MVGIVRRCVGDVTFLPSLPICVYVKFDKLKGDTELIRLGDDDHAHEFADSIVPILPMEVPY